MENLLILGAGGYGHTVLEAAQLVGAFASIAFLDDNSAQAAGVCADYTHAVFRQKYAFAYPAFGNNELRAQWLKRLRQAGYKLPVVVHPRACVSAGASLAEGAVVLAQAVVSCGCKVETGAIINIGALVDHDCTVGACAHLAPGVVMKAGTQLAAGVKLESGSVLHRGE